MDDKIFNTADDQRIIESKTRVTDFSQLFFNYESLVFGLLLKMLFWHVHS